MRVFISIDIDDDVVRTMAKNVQEILKGLRIRATYPKLEDLHITIKFIGEIDSGVLGEILFRLNEVRFSSFELKVDGVDGFPSIERPRVVFLRIRDDTGELQRLKAVIENRLTGLVGRDTKKFRPHITVARIKQQVVLRPDTLKSFTLDSDVELVVESFKVKESILTPRGPIYKTIKEFRAEG